MNKNETATYRARLMRHDPKRKYYGCCALSCTNSSTNCELSFFSLPQDIERRNAWLQLVQREDLVGNPSTHFRLCENHFEKSFIVYTSVRKLLKRTAMPIKVKLVNNNSSNSDDDTNSNADTTEASTQCEETQHKETQHKETQHEGCSTITHNEYHYSIIPAKRQKLWHAGTKYETLFILCNKLLPKNLTNIIQEQIKLQLKDSPKRYSIAYKIFCLNLFHASPQAYKLLEDTLCLPSKAELKRMYMPLSTALDVDSCFMQVLKAKGKDMNSEERNCSLMLSVINIKPNLLYNIKSDKIYGFHEVDGVQSPQPATLALVAMVRGLAVNYEQLVGYALLAECKCYQTVIDWINKLIQKLYEIGLNVRCLVYDIDSNILNDIRERLVSKETPFYYVNDKKVYVLFDSSSLIKSVRDSMLNHVIHFNDNNIAKWDYIVQFYDRDKSKKIRLAPKLTDSHVKPNASEKNNVNYAVQVFSTVIAAGLSIYNEFGVFDQCAEGTIKFILIMNYLHNFLNSTTACRSNKYHNAYSGKQYQISFVNEMLDLFSSLKLFDAHGEDNTLKATFIEGYQITLKSLSLMFEDLKLEGCTEIKTYRLNKDSLNKFFRRLSTKYGNSKETTSWQLVSVFKKLFFIDILRPQSKKNCKNDLSQIFMETNFLHSTSSAIDQPSSSAVKQAPPSTSTSVETIDVEAAGPSAAMDVKIELLKDDSEAAATPNIPISDYKSFSLPQHDALTHMSEYLLSRCAAHHHACPVLHFHSHNTSTPSLTDLIPHSEFMQFLESMEAAFCSFFTRTHIQGPLMKTFIEYTQDISFPMPCPCFPLDYCKNIYFGIRLHNTLKYNNNTFGQCNYEQNYTFSVLI